MSKQNKKALISIICTLYNYRIYLGALIESVLSQTYENWELLIIDDASTDNPMEVVANYDDNRIKYFKFEENRGYSVAKNEGILKSKGEFIVMIDADDLLTKDSLEVRHSAMIKNPERLWCHGDAISLTADNKFSDDDFLRRKRLRAKFIGEGRNLEVWYHVTLVHAQGVMVRRKLHEKVGLYDETMRASADTEMWDRMIQLGCIPIYVVVPVCIYRSHDRQMHNSKYKRQNKQYLLNRRAEVVAKRVAEGINKNNTRLL
jgi:glycosyltransferase involved in cell wall biosynthesis